MATRTSTMGALLLAILASAAAAQSQQPELRVRIELDSQTPLSGALVGLIDATDRVAVEALSSVTGWVTLGATPGTYRARVRRIGFRPFYSEPVTIPRSSELILRVESPRVVLT